MKNNKQTSAPFTMGNYNKYYLILTAVVSIVFANSLFNGYNMDDHLVTQNHIYTAKGISALKDILTSNYYSNNSDINFDYRPLVHVSFAVEHQIFGEHAGISHFINLLIYLATVLLLFKLCIKLGGENYLNAALLTSLIFAVHPIHTETVASIKNRDELLALFFGLTSFYVFIKYTKNNSINWLILASLSFTLGLLAKKSIYPIAIILPATLFLLNFSTLKKTLIVTLTLAIPSAIIGSDLLFNKAIILFILPFLGLLIIYILSDLSYFSEFFKKNIFKLPVDITLISLSLVTFAIGFLLKEIIIVVPAILLAILLPKSNRPSVLFLIAIQIMLTAFLFDVKMFHKYSLIPAIAAIISILNLSKRKKIDFLVLSTSIIPLIAYLYVHKSLISASIFVEIALYFFLLHKRSIWGLGFIVFSTLISAIFFQSSIFHYILIGFAAVKTINDSALSIKLGIEKPLFKFAASAILVFSVFSFNQVHSPYADKCKQQYNRFQTEYLNDKPTEIKNTGRKINYIENTLSGKYTRAEILATGFATIAEYARLTFYPIELSFYYGYAKVKTVNLSDKTAWFGLIFYLALITLAIWQFKKHPSFSIGIAWYLLSLSLFSNWIEPVAGMVGERLAYTASVGFCLALSALILWLKPSFSFFKPKGIELFIIVILVLFSLRSISRNNDWKDPITLMENDIEHLEKSAQAHNLLALNLMYASTNNSNINEQKALEMQNKAAFHLQKSIEIYPHFFNTNFDLARIYIGWGDFAKAKPVLEQALNVDSENLFALEELAKTCYELKLVDETENYANMYLAKVPQNENMHEVLIYNMLANGKYQSAINYAERALSYYPNNEIINRMYADAKRLSGNTTKINQ